MLDKDILRFAFRRLANIQPLLLKISQYEGVRDFLVSKGHYYEISSFQGARLFVEDLLKSLLWKVPQSDKLILIKRLNKMCHKAPCDLTDLRTINVVSNLIDQTLRGY